MKDYDDKRVLYYALVVRHPKEGNPPLPVAEMITNDQSAYSIRTFLERFRRDESLVFKGNVTIPRQLNSDYSKAIILAVLKEFNAETLNAFLARAFKILQRKAEVNDFKFMIPHVGCSHFMAIMHRKLKGIIKAKKEQMQPKNQDTWYRFNMYCVSLLVNARTLEEFDSILKHVATCLLNDHQTDSVHISFTWLWDMIHNMEKNVPEFESNQQDVTTGDHSESDEGISNGNANGNPFIAHFEGIIEEVLLYNTEIDEDSMEEESITHDANRSYCPEFFNFLKSYLHEMPLWSGVLLGSLDRYQLTLDRDDLQDYPYLSFKSVNAKTKGYIECAMRNLKQDDFPGRSRLRPDAFVLENYQRIRRRGNDYGDRIASKRGQKRKKNNERIESTRRDVKKQKVNGNKKKENKFEAKERHEKFSKPAKNPAVKVKDLSNSDQNAETEKNYSTVQETWGKKDPLTPKRDPKIGQFQQSPPIPLSKTPDVKRRII